MTKPKTERRARRRHPLVIAAAALLLLVVAAVPAIWWIARDQVAGALDNAQRDARKDGITLAHQGLSFSGFPFQLSATLNRPRATWSDGSWQGPEQMVGRTSFSDPTLLRFDGKGTHRLVLDGLGFTIDSEQADALVEIGSAGAEGLQAALADAKVDLDQGLGQALVKRLDLAAAPLPPLSDPTQRTTVVLNLEQLTLPQVLGAAIPDLGAEIQSGSLRALLTGPLKPGPAPMMLRAWRDGGGYIDLEQAELTWGPFSLEAGGRLTLDQELRPTGTLNLDIAGAPAVLKALAAAGKFDPSQARTYGKLLEGIAQPRDGKPGRWIALPLVLRDGHAYLQLPLGRIPLARVSPVVPLG